MGAYSWTIPRKIGYRATMWQATISRCRTLRADRVITRRFEWRWQAVPVILWHSLSGAVCDEMVIVKLIRTRG